MTNKLFFQKVWNEWINFVNFDEEQTSFNLGSWSYTFHKYTKMLKTFIEEYNCPTNSWAKHFYGFSYAIGFSKSGLKKYIKDNNIVPIMTNTKKEEVNIWWKDF